MTTKFKSDILKQAYLAVTSSSASAEDKIANAAKAEALVFVASQMEGEVDSFEVSF